ncbi:glutathione S-transferase C-terminal domain-containing protein [Brachybacterium huguangmaarense]|uniref:Glutathione S-transferase C-terminal domain-containing protein n=1 Tax=Brachybacterium huguangmaarense TaxID=1652028 RepID=A0ABY6FZT2_9MICO|nr:glutathione S-transferase C-terminal domain-containing protein [Brachybacterium huguangmaarense]UYG16462.1 glutathione S-transferase C-terminal domain-containing protein [Brachybacterium huguangmaarense]
MSSEESGSYVHEGEAFDRDMRYIDTRITRDARDGYGVEPGRYRLIVARACPWAHRAVISRRLLGLEDVISMGIAGPVHDWRSWSFDLDPGGRDPVLGIERLREAYFRRVPDYPRGITVPAMVDTRDGAVVTNDFQQMTLDFATEWTAFQREGAPDLYPAGRREEIDELNRWMLHHVNNGVYRTGFAGSQAEYEKAYRDLWESLDVLEERLGRSRYLMGPSITEADVRLFPTLIRFDVVYFAHFKANRQPLFTLPNLWNYTKDLFATPGFGDTVDFQQIKEHYYVVQTDVNPTRIVPLGPDLSGLLEPHDRDRFESATWGAGTAPGPVAAAERVDPAHTPWGAASL